MNKIKYLLLLLFLILCSTYLLKDLFKSGFYTSHDGPHQIVRFFYFDKLISEGVIPPRWVTGLNNGYGYPLFIFSYHASWYIAEIFRFFGFGIIDSVKYTFLAGYIISGATMFFFLKTFLSKSSAYIGTFIYLISPYRFSNIFVRAAIGDATAFIFLPLLFYALYLSHNGKKISIKSLFIGSIGLAGLILSHAMVALIVIGFSVLYVILTVLFERKLKIFLKNYLLILLLGFSLSAYYLLPSIFERNLTIFSGLMDLIYSGTNFLNLKDLIYSPWGYGMIKAEEGGMSVQIGITNIIIFISFFVLVLFKKNHNKVKKFESWKYIIIFIFSILLTLRLSQPLWKIINIFFQIDFVLRLLTIAVFSSSVITALLMERIINKKMKLIFGILIIFLSIFTNRNHLRINQSLDWSVDFFLKLEKTTNSYNEYFPKTADQNYVDIKRDEIEFLDNNLQINKVISKNNSLEFDYQATDKGKLRVNRLYYPEWEYIIDGKKEKYEIQNGVIEIKYPSGLHRIRLSFKDTLLRKTANLISLITLGAMVVSLLISKRLKRYE